MGHPQVRGWLPLGAAIALLLAGCGPAAPQPVGREQPAPPPRQTKSLTIGLSTTVDLIGIATALSPVGGVGFLDEIHSNSLVTSEEQSRKPIGRLAERVPTLEDGSVALLADGRMRVTFHLRRGVVWHDGTPLTAHDLVFSHRIQTDPRLPLWKLEGAKEMEATEASDDFTFVVTYRQPYYRGTVLGVRSFWPVAAHILGGPYERFLESGVPDEIVNHPYWSGEYVALGPFRVAEFKHGQEIVFEAHDRYFLGRPKVDVIRARIFSDQDALLSSVFAGAIDIVPELALNPERGQQAKERWDASRDGTMHVRDSAPWMITPQLRPHLQREPAILDPRVRAGLYHAIDREALSDALNGGNRDLAAYSILARSDELYEAAKDGLRRYPYDVERARVVLRETGWTAGLDGALHHQSDGRRYRTVVTAATGNERATAAIGAYWRQIGIEVEEVPMSPVLLRDREGRSQFPGWEVRGSPGGHGVLQVFEAPAAGPANRWVGNRPGYEEPRMQQLIDTLRASPAEQGQLQAMHAISEFVAADLPLLMLYHGADYLGVRRGVRALDDLAGAQGAVPLYGHYARNAHLWDVM